MKRRLTLVLVATVTATALLCLTSHLLGIGGYRNGRILIGIVVSAGAATVFRLATPRDAFDPRIWTFSVALVTFTLGTIVGAAAPASRGALSAELDTIPLPFFVVVGEETSGHSWCRPQCPVVERRYRGPRTNPEAALATVVGALAAAKIEVSQVELSTTERRGTMEARTPRYRIRVIARGGSSNVDQPLELDIQLTATR